MRDVVIFCAVVLTFAVFATVHVVICASLLRRVPAWKAALALIVPPLAPVFAFRADARGLATVWGVAAIAYAACLGMSLD